MRRKLFPSSRTSSSSSSNSTKADLTPGASALILAVVFGLAAAAYLPAMTGFIDFWDGSTLDHLAMAGYYYEKLVFNEPASWLPIFTFWDGTVWARHWQTCSFLVDMMVWGDFFPGYQITQLFLHFACVVCLYFLLRRITRSNLWACLAGAIFAVHPLSIAAVTNPQGRGDLLAVLFVLAGLWGLCTWMLSSTSRPGVAIATVFVFFAGLWAKETVVLTPFLGLAILAGAVLTLPRGVRAARLRERLFVPLAMLVIAGWFYTTAPGDLEFSRTMAVNSLVLTLPSLAFPELHKVIPYAPMVLVTAIPLFCYAAGGRSKAVLSLVALLCVTAAMAPPILAGRTAATPLAMVWKPETRQFYLALPWISMFLASALATALEACPRGARIVPCLIATVALPVIFLVRTTQLSGCIPVAGATEEVYSLYTSSREFITETCTGAGRTSVFVADRGSIAQILRFFNVLDGTFQEFDARWYNFKDRMGNAVMMEPWGRENIHGRRYWGTCFGNTSQLPAPSPGDVPEPYRFMYLSVEDHRFVWYDLTGILDSWSGLFCRDSGSYADLAAFLEGDRARGQATPVEAEVLRLDLVRWASKYRADVVGDSAGVESAGYDLFITRLPAELLTREGSARLIIDPASLREMKEARGGGTSGLLDLVPPGDLRFFPHEAHPFRLPGADSPAAAFPEGFFLELSERRPPYLHSRDLILRVWLPWTGAQAGSAVPVLELSTGELSDHVRIAQ